MMKIRDLAGRELRWIQPKVFKREYELQDGGGTVMTLGFPGWFNSHAVAQSAEGCWQFLRGGFLKTKVRIRPCDAELELGVFQAQTWKKGGILRLPDGRRFPTRTNFWTTEYEFKTEAGLPLVKFRKSGRLFRPTWAVQVHDASASLDDLPWVVALGYYLILLIKRDSATVVAAS